MMVKKGTKRTLDFITTLIVSIFFLVLASGMAAGAIAFQGFLAFIPPLAVVIIGWIFIVLIIINVITSFINLFTKR